MSQRSVIFSPKSRSDLRALLLYIARVAGPAIAVGYIGRVESFCLGLDLFPERGSLLPSGTRVLAFEDSATVRIRVTPRVVRILRIAYRGRDLSKEHT